jgi:hypothetical protein
VRGLGDGRTVQFVLEQVGGELSVDVAPLRERLNQIMLPSQPRHHAGFDLTAVHRDDTVVGGCREGASQVAAPW